MRLHGHQSVASAFFRPLLALIFSPMRPRASCVWARVPRRQSERLRRGRLLQSEVGKNVIRLSVEKVCHGVIMVVRHWFVNGSCGCDRNRTEDQGSDQDARNFRNHNGSPLVSDRPSLAFR